MDYNQHQEDSKKDIHHLNPENLNNQFHNELQSGSQTYDKKSSDSIQPQMSINRQKLSKTEHVFTIIFGLITLILLIIFFYYLYEICCKNKCNNKQKSIMITKKQKDLRKGKPKKKHNYNPYDIMNTRERKECGMIKEKSLPKLDQNLKVEDPNIQQQNQSQNNNKCIQIPIDNVGVKKSSKLKKSVEISNDVKNKPKPVIHDYESSPSKNYYVPLSNDNKKPNVLQIKNEVLENLEKSKFLKRKLLTNNRSLKNIISNQTPACTCNYNCENKKTVTFATVGREDKWETVNENDAMSNFSFQISSRNST